MPNGHGGIPFLGAPILLAILFAAIAWLPGKLEGGLGWAQVGFCVLLAGGLGWRLAYHLHMWNADDYGGAYTSKDVYHRALRRYRALAVVYTAISASAGFGILWWRGLP